MRGCVVVIIVVDRFIVIATPLSSSSRRRWRCRFSCSSKFWLATRRIWLQLTGLPAADQAAASSAPLNHAVRTFSSAGCGGLGITNSLRHRAAAHMSRNTKSVRIMHSLGLLGGRLSAHAVARRREGCHGRW